MTNVESAGITDVGRKRKANEDSIYIDDEMRLFIVADGMGGHKAGEVASRVVVETIRDSMQRFSRSRDGAEIPYSQKELSPEANQLVSSIHLANQTVFQLSRTERAYDGMGSTVSAILIAGSSIIAANVGDSPIYLFRDEEIQTLSTPHTYVAELAALDPSAAEKLSEQYRHMITRGMGLKEDVVPDVKEISAQKGDRIVICSDGLSDKASPEDIRSAIDDMTPKSACKALVNMANERGGDDNITVIVLAFPPDTAKAAPLPKPTAVKQPSSQPPSTTGALAKLIQVDIDTDEASHSSEISVYDDLQGGHVQTTDPYTLGEELTLTFADPSGKGYFTVSGAVTGRDTSGIDVTFEDITDELAKKISALK